jgi:hypothetical protein
MGWSRTSAAVEIIGILKAKNIKQTFMLIASPEKG